MEYVNLRDEAPVFLLYVFVCIICITTSNCIFVVVGGRIVFYSLSFLILTQLQNKFSS